MADVSETPEEAKYTMNEVIHMDKCGVLPDDFKMAKNHANAQFDQLHWPSFLSGIEAGAAQCMANLGKEYKFDDSMRNGMHLLMKRRENDEFRGKHMSNMAELIVGIISGTIDPKQVK